MLITRIVGFAVAILIVSVAMGDIGLVLSPGGPFFIVLGTALGGGLMTAGSRTGAVCRTLLSSRSESPQLTVGIRVLRTARFGALAGGFFALVVGLVMVMKDIDDPSVLGPSLEIAQRGLFWTLILGYFVLLPLQTRLEHQLVQLDEEVSFAEMPLDLLVLIGGFVFSGIFLALTNYLF